MARTEHFVAGTALRIEAQRTDSGWIYYAWRPNTSQVFTDSTSLLRWVKWPTKTPTGDALRQWLSALEGAPHPEPAPAHGLDADDPNHQTRTVI